MAENPLELRIPGSSTSSEGGIATTPEEVNSWLERLPLAAIGESSRQVFEAILELNRLDIPQRARIKIADLFLQPVAYLTENLRKSYIVSAFPLSEKSRKNALLARELHTQLAIAYKLATDQLIRDEKRRPDRQLLLIAIHRALRCLYRVLYQSVIVYEPYPQGAWSEIHRLFACAEQNRIHGLPVKEEGEENDTSTIDDLYRQILLFSISSPYRLRQSEIDYIRRQLPYWDRLTTLGRVERHARSDGLFITRLDSDLPPSHQGLQPGSSKKGCRQLNTRGLVGWLREELDQLPARLLAGSNLGVDDLTRKQLTRQMIQAFSTLRKRKFVRSTLNCELLHVVGIPALHAVLRTGKPEGGEQRDPHPSRQEQDLDWFEATHNRPLINTLLYTSEESAAYTLMHLVPKEQNQSNPTPGQSQLRRDKKQPPCWTIDSEQEVTEPFSCTALNQSASGYCLRWQGTDAPKLRVGEILGIQSTNDGDRFNIGVSRWLKHIPGEGLNVGMELISPSSTPLFARLTDAPANAESQRRCLLLPELKTAARPATLVMPRLAFKTGDQLSVTGGTRESQVRLTRLLEATGSFALFQFVYLDDSGTE